MTYVIDIDDTLLLYNRKGGEERYGTENIDKEELKLIKKLFSKGHVIILYTGRNWDCYQLTVEQLRHYGVPYSQLVMGKPQGIYIDKDSYKTLKEALNENK